MPSMVYNSAEARKPQNRIVYVCIRRYGCCLYINANYGMTGSGGTFNQLRNPKAILEAACQ